MSIRKFMMIVERAMPCDPSSSAANRLLHNFGVLSYELEHMCNLPSEVDGSIKTMYSFLKSLDAKSNRKSEVEEEFTNEPTIMSATQKDGNINRKTANRMVDPKGWLPSAHNKVPTNEGEEEIGDYKIRTMNNGKYWTYAVLKDGKKKGAQDSKGYRTEKEAKSAAKRAIKRYQEQS